MQSDLSPTTRLVLFVLASHLNAVGESCFPSTRRIALESGLSERSVCTHLDIAEKEGWIAVSQHGFKGQKWRRNEYEPTFQGIQKGTEGGSARYPKGTEPDDKKALKEVQSSRPLRIDHKDKEEIYKEEIPQNRDLQIHRTGAVSLTTIAFDQFWEIYPRKRGKKPSRDKWRSKQLDSKIEMILIDIENRVQNDERWQDGFIPDPATYINQERWEDELTGGNHGTSRKLCAVDRVIEANVRRLRALGDLPPEPTGNISAVCQLFPHVSG
jgi:hypothetical protein